MHITQHKQFILVLLTATAVLLGAALGIASYTFVYADGASYFSDRPEACANCHVMREVLHDWRSGDHHHVAMCNDCHVPQNLLAKLIVKGINGFHHSYAFTFSEASVIIRAKALSRQIVQNNCLRCHGAIFADPGIGSRRDNNQTSVPTNSCISCHRQVGHLH